MPKFSLLLATIVLALAGCGGGGGGGAGSASGDGRDGPGGQPGSGQPVLYNVGGMLAGLGAGKSVTLAHVDAAGATAQSASFHFNGAYSLRLPAGTAYNLRVLVQPVGQVCTVREGTGVVAGEVNNIAVTCVDELLDPQARPVAGQVTGLAGGQTLVLMLTAHGVTQEAIVHADGSFQFPSAVTGTYTVSVKSAPAGQACAVANAEGAAGGTAVVTVACTSAQASFHLAGTVIGNSGAVTLRNATTGESATVSGNGGFAFTQPLLPGAAYAVSVVDTSSWQTCSVANGTGTAGAQAASILVTCTPIVLVNPVLPVPATPAGLTLTYGVKSLSLAWGTVTAPAGGGTVTYRVFEDPDGPGPAGSMQIAAGLSSGTYTRAITGLLRTLLNAQYRVQACNSYGCDAPSAAVALDVTRAIGYFKASNTAAAHQFGHAVALSGDGLTLAVGAPFEGGAPGGADSGAVYVYARSSGIWAFQAYVKASNASAGDQFGYAVALSQNGNTLAVGAPFQDVAGAANSGASYVFARAAGSWAQQAYLKASNAGADHAFGWSLALSADGTTLAVGAPHEGGSATGTFVVTPPAGAGAPLSGAVYVYALSAGWTQQAYVKATNTEDFDRFGHAVALSGDGHTLAVGAYLEGSGATGVDGDQANNNAPVSGAVYVYSRSGLTWARQAYLKASNAEADDQFGWSVALSADGTTLAVGANGENSALTGDPSNNGAMAAGAVYLFVRNGASWVQQAYVKASNPDGADVFGWSVSLSADGHTLAVGAVGEGSDATGLNGDQGNGIGPPFFSKGAAYLFTRAGAAWTQLAFVKASNTGMGDRFGQAVSLAGNGSTLAVSADWESSNATGINGNQADDSAAAAGAVYLY